ncbi:hypothetical protein HNP46_006927 [Pseudomonas nitritireducens]|uniref:Uncharacterized protein n=1 Tax=Pseudomonas nitroreducens TaxID=46680 RepID=A0A7W7KTF8_PSENT|nr:DUF6685 family protein [Pseudomonas nitritireducens]MBB4868008.1 hypothetical protein [Pseudomonas nitritireducens]
MSQPTRPRSVTSRLAALAQRLGIGAADGHNVAERSRILSLPFDPLPTTASGIGWQSGPPLHRLIDLPRGALSGPVQEDKARIHAVLARLVVSSQEQHPAVDLRSIDGLCCRSVLDSSRPTLEELSNCEQCRKVRIISYNDFTKVLGVALPGFERKAPLHLRSAGWHGSRLFWDDDSHPCELASAVVYARRRGLEIILPARIQRHALQASVLDELERDFHMLGMPAKAWSDSAFMALLLETGMPYARFGLFNSETPESLLLPRDHPQADALGRGLREAGAADVIAYLRRVGSAA